MPERETLEGGPAAPGPDARRRLVGVALALGGAVVGAAVVLSVTRSDPDPVPAPPAAVSSDVRLVVTATADRPVAEDALWVDAVLLLAGGPDRATVTRVHRPGDSLDIRVPELPVELTPAEPFALVRLRIAPRDCRLADMWTPSARPFTVTWRSGDGRQRSGQGGDHDADMELAWLNHMDEVCAERGR